MANFRAVNRAVRKAYPDLDIEVVRGEGYVYYSGEDAYDRLDSIMTHPTSTPTEDVIRMALDDIAEIQEGDL